MGKDWSGETRCGKLREELASASEQLKWERGSSNRFLSSQRTWLLTNQLADEIGRAHV